MKLTKIKIRTAAAKSRSAFTLIEVLAALMFMAIVIPVVMEGLHVASLAGEVSQRKAVAIRVAERVLNEMKVTGQLENTGQTGLVQEGAVQYRWTLRTEIWPEDTMRQSTVDVVFKVRGRDYDVHLTTLIGEAPTEI